MAEEIEKYRYVKCTNADEYWWYNKVMHGLHFPRWVVTEGSKPPAELAWKLYSQYPSDSPEYEAIAPRHGSKTTIATSWELNSCVHVPGVEFGHLSATENQSINAYSGGDTSFLRLLKNGYQDSYSKTNSEKTVFHNGSSLQLVIGTESGANGPHFHKLVVDEQDLLRSERVLDEIQGLRKDGTDDIQTQVLYISSYKKPDYLVTMMKDALPEENVYRWTALDCVKPCTLADCGSCKEIECKDKRSTWYEQCRGRCKNTDGYMSIKHYQGIFKTSSLALWNAQYMSNVPTITGAVFDWTQTAIGDYKWNREHGVKFFLGLDFGWKDPNVALIFQYYDSNWYIIDYFTRTSTTKHQFALELKNYLLGKYVQVSERAWGDPSSPEGKREIGNFICQCSSPHKLEHKKLDQSLEIIDLYGKLGRIKIDRRVEPLINEMQAYRKIGNSSFQGEDHFIDAMRYGILGYIEHYKVRD